MRPLLPAAVALAFALACTCGGGDRDYATEARPVWHGTVDGVDVAIDVELHGWRVAGHLGPELRWVEARDHWAFYDRVVASRAGVALPHYDVGSVPSIPAPPDEDAGEATLATLEVEACTVPHGVVYRRGDRAWTAAFVVGDALFRGPAGADGAACADVAAALPPVERWLAAAGDMTTCRALDDGGRRDLLVDCFVAAREYDGNAVAPPPERGPVVLKAQIAQTGDRAAVVERLAADPAALAALERRLLDAPPDALHPGKTVALLEPLARAGRFPAFVAQVAAQCADAARPCATSTLELAQYALRWEGAVAEEACPAAAALAATVRARPDPDAATRAFVVLAGFSGCEGQAFRAQMLAALPTRTAPDLVLRSPDQRAYDTVDPECRPSLVEGRRHVGPLCRTAARFAGTWLGDRCGPDAVSLATRLAAAAPRAPFDPREDQVLDGALRVLAACDVPAFEAAIAHVPPETVAVADLRSRRNLRRAYGVPEAPPR